MLGQKLYLRAKKKLSSRRIEIAVEKRFFAFQQLLGRLEALFGKDRLASLRILDLGTGYHHPYAMLLKPQVRSISGLDIIDVFASGGGLQFYQSRRRNGTSIARAAVSTVATLLQNRVYYRALGRYSGTKLSKHGYNLRTYGGDVFPFDDSSFDCIISNAVLEHVMDMTTLASESARVLVPGGVIDFVWHNYYSLSGNHLGEAINKRHPWGHLTGDVENTPVHLNRLRPEQIRERFETCFDINRMVGLSWDHIPEGGPGHSYEGEHLMNDPLRAKLSDYSDSLLLNVCFLIQARKRDI